MSKLALLGKILIHRHVAMLAAVTRCALECSCRHESTGSPCAAVTHALTAAVSGCTAAVPVSYTPTSDRVLQPTIRTVRYSDSRGTEYQYVSKGILGIFIAWGITLYSMQTSLEVQ